MQVNSPPENGLASNSAKSASSWSSSSSISANTVPWILECGSATQFSMGSFTSVLMRRLAGPASAGMPPMLGMPIPGMPGGGGGIPGMPGGGGGGGGPPPPCAIKGPQGVIRSNNASAYILHGVTYVRQRQGWQGTLVSLQTRRTIIGGGGGMLPPIIGGGGGGGIGAFAVAGGGGGPPLVDGELAEKSSSSASAAWSALASATTASADMLHRGVGTDRTYTDQIKTIRLHIDCMGRPRPSVSV